MDCTRSSHSVCVSFLVPVCEFLPVPLLHRFLFTRHGETERGKPTEMFILNPCTALNLRIVISETKIHSYFYKEFLSVCVKASFLLRKWNYLNKCILCYFGYLISLDVQLLQAKHSVAKTVMHISYKLFFPRISVNMLRGSLVTMAWLQITNGGEGSCRYVE
jgi:hypothetical protein